MGIDKRRAIVILAGLGSLGAFSGCDHGESVSIGSTDVDAGHTVESNDVRPTDTPPPGDAETVDAADTTGGRPVDATDASSTPGKQDVDTGNCHIDCFQGGLACKDGALWRFGGGVAPCDQEFPGPTCSTKRLGTCAHGCQIRWVSFRTDAGPLHRNSDPGTIADVMCRPPSGDAGDTSDAADTPQQDTTDRADAGDAHGP